MALEEIPSRRVVVAFFVSCSLNPWLKKSAGKDQTRKNWPLHEPTNVKKGLFSENKNEI